MVPQGQALGNKPGLVMLSPARRVDGELRSVEIVALAAKSSTIAHMEPVAQPHQRLFNR